MKKATFLFLIDPSSSVPTQRTTADAYVSGVRTAGYNVAVEIHPATNVINNLASLPKADVVVIRGRFLMNYLDLKTAKTFRRRLLAMQSAGHWPQIIVESTDQIGLDIAKHLGIATGDDYKDDLDYVLKMVENHDDTRLKSRNTRIVTEEDWGTFYTVSPQERRKLREEEVTTKTTISKIKKRNWWSWFFK
ncbi:hypothetical protein KC929_00485 [Patescibacteria group bacterium]|nr:hypothetical protein [Patescibacteria group bacterium]